MIDIVIYNCERGNTFTRSYKKVHMAKKFLNRIKDKYNLIVEQIDCDPSIRKELTNLL